MEISINYEEAKDYDVIDLNTNQRIPNVQWADDERGLYIVLVFDTKGEVVFENPDTKNNVFPKVELKRGNIKIVKKESK